MDLSNLSTAVRVGSMADVKEFKRWLDSLSTDETKTISTQEQINSFIRGQNV